MSVTRGEYESHALKPTADSGLYFIRFVGRYMIVMLLDAPNAIDKNDRLITVIGNYLSLSIFDTLKNILYEIEFMILSGG